MRKTLKKYFIPHQGNDHKPHILHWEATLVLLSIILAVEIAFLYGTLILLPKTKFFSAVLPAVLVDLTNQNRVLFGLNQLQPNSLLEKAALLKAQDMAGKGYFSHNTPDGKTPWYWLEQVGYRYGSAGENLAVNFFESQDVVSAWMNSETHRANILNKGFTEIGIATAKGTYQGQQVIFAVQFFGRPSLTPVAQAAIEPAAAFSSRPQPAPIQGESISNQSPEPQSQPAQTLETFIAVEPETIAPISFPTANAGRSAPFLAQFLTNPTWPVKLLYLTLATLIALALVLKIFINIKVQHPRLIIHGVALLLIIGSALLLNQYLLLSQVKIL